MNSNNRNPSPTIKHLASVLRWLCLGALAFAPLMASASLREGDTVPEVELLDENAKPVELAVEGRPTLITFIFTRCAAMEFCPRMAKQFESLQEALQKADRSDLRLLSITLDPEHDQPALLKQYGEAVGADPAIWNFATGEVETIDNLTREFRVYRDRQGGVLNHGLCTALIRPDGTIAMILRGNAWTTEEVLASLE